MSNKRILPLLFKDCWWPMVPGLYSEVAAMQKMTFHYKYEK